MLTHIFRILRLQNPKKSVFKGAHISKPSIPPSLPKIKFIEDMSFFMHKCIDRINVESDNNCGFRVTSGLPDKGDVDHQFICRHLIQEMTTHIESYTNPYWNKSNYDTILNAIVPYPNDPTLFDKWMRFSEIRHLIANAYDKVCFDLT